ISELGQIGLGVGAAMAGARSIVDIVFLDMIMEAMGQVVEQAATIHYTSNGRIKVPIVIRAAMGTIRSTGPHHSRCFYSWFAHIPGLKVVLPASPEDVKGFMKTGRLVIVDEAQAFCGFSAEIAAIVSEQALEFLNAPIQRVCALHTPHPFNGVLEAAMLPSMDGIVEAIREAIRG